MTVMLIKLIEDVVRTAQKICPCIFDKRELFKMIQKGPKNSAVGDPCIYIYPNRHDHSLAVYIKDAKTGRKKKTDFVLPLWIWNNTSALLKRRNELAAKVGRETAESRRQEDRVEKLSSQVKLVKKEVFSIRKDLQSIATYLKTGGRTPIHANH